MELTRITKLLLWLLNKRPDIGELTVRDQPTTDYSLDLNEILLDLTPEERLTLQIDLLNDCFDAPSSS